MLLYILQTLSLKPNAITRKRDARNAIALDAENNNIQVKDIVKVTDGPHSVRIQSVKSKTINSLIIFLENMIIILLLQSFSKHSIINE